MTIEDLLPRPRHSKPITETGIGAESIDAALPLRTELVPFVSSLEQCRKEANLALPRQVDIEAMLEECRSTIDSIISNEVEPNPILPRETMIELPDRELRVIEATHDPLEPPRHRLIETSKASSTQLQKAAPAQTPILRAPVPAMTSAERQAWNIPVAVSQWKNPKGYILPLEHRQMNREKPQSGGKQHASLARALEDAEDEKRSEAAARAEKLRLAQRQFDLRQRLLQKKGLNEMDSKSRRQSESTESEQVIAEPDFDSRLYHRAKRRPEVYDEPLFEPQDRRIYRPSKLMKKSALSSTAPTGPPEFERDEQL